MITIDLKRDKHSIEKLLALASSESLLIYDKDGNHFILEETDNFKDEIKQLGTSQKFMKLLEERSKGKETIPISAIAKKLGLKEKVNH